MRHTPRTFRFTAVLPAVLIGMSLTACAMAQEDMPPASGGSKQTFSYQRSEGEGKSIELRVENGRVLVAKVNGQSIPADRVKKVNGGYDIVDAEGRVLQHVEVAHAQGGSAGGSSGGSSGGTAAGTSTSTSGNGRASARANAETRSRLDELRREQDEVEIEGAPPSAGPGGREGRRVVIRGDRGPRTIAPRTAIGTTEAAEAPKSMIGVGLGAPDGALAHHLKFDAKKSTMVQSVVEGLPAQAAGLERYDIIVGVNGGTDASTANLYKVLRETEPGAKVALDVLRGTETRKLEITAVEFDAEQLDSATMNVEGFALPEGMNFDEAAEAIDVEILDGTGGNVMFFVGPDGRRREVRMPVMPAMPALPGFSGGPGGGGFDPAQMEEFNRAMEQMNERMEQWARQMERSAREQGIDGEEFVEGGPVPGPRNARPRDNDDRMRRLEERLEQLMRELERERAEKGARRQGA